MEFGFVGLGEGLGEAMLDWLIGDGVAVLSVGDREEGEVSWFDSRCLGYFRA